MAAMQKTTDIIFEQLQTIILQNKLNPGDKLPSERKLAQMLGASRASIREVVGIMDAKGMVQVRHGKSTIICDIFNEPISKPLEEIILNSDALVEQVIAVRQILEVEATRLAAIARTDAELEAIKQAYQVTKTTSDKADIEAFVKADTHFHITIGEASHNIILTQLIKSISALISQNIYKSVTNLKDDVNWAKNLQKQHLDIVNAIAEQNPDRAKTTASDHLDYVLQYHKKSTHR